MTEPSRPPSLPKWPFFLGDALLLAVALVCYAQGRHWPFGSQAGLSAWEGWVLAFCIFLGAALGALPFLLEYRVWIQWAQLDRAQSAVAQVRNIEPVGRQIASATASWQAVQDDANKSVSVARELFDRMSAEATAFQEFLTKANDKERAHLRLEVDKLRRAQGDWLQVLVRILDHVWALYRAAVRSGKLALVEQLSYFQRACRDASLRVGLVPFVAKVGEAIDPELHQPVGPPPTDAAGSVVSETVATGYRFQGQLVRKALVSTGPPEPPAPEVPEPSPDQSSVEGTSESAPASPLEGPVPVPSDEAPTEIIKASDRVDELEETPVDIPSGSGHTEFTRRLADEFEESSHTEFVRQLGSADAVEAESEDEDPARID